MVNCRNGDAGKKETQGPPLFTLLPAEESGVTFNNKLTEGLNTNVLMYEYFYNGGGVAAGDVNGDGFDDLYFTGNMVSNKLYLNEGKMRFRDVTDAAGVAGRPGPWKTGTTMTDINGDGKLDIYVCYSGKLRGEKRRNSLFINKGNDGSGIPRFEDQAEAYGLADSSFSTQAAFFDFDRDGDLDMLLVNHNPARLGDLYEPEIRQLLGKTDPLSSTRLFQNDQGHFKDITHQAGLSESGLNYGLSAGIADINNDGLQDIYTCSDYLTPDHLYINNGNGSFSDRLQECMGHTSYFSMGNDIADINNDGLEDIFTLDMLPEDNRRQKLLAAPDNYALFDLNLNSGFYYQYMRNMLHLNNGNGTFSEVGQLAGVSNTDWSWAALLADYDNDGYKDLLVTNGYVRDYTNMDFLKFMSDKLKGRQEAVWRKDLLEMVNKMPSSNMVNYIFRNNGGLTFSNATGEWGINLSSNSNGAAYADLDNDGDLDLIINNINEPAFIYKNEESKLSSNHYLQVSLDGSGLNTQGIGAKLGIYTREGQQYLTQMPVRGFQSGISPVLHFGLGSNATIDSLRIIWVSGRQQVLRNIKGDQKIVLHEKDAIDIYRIPPEQNSLFHEIKTPVSYSQPVKKINDFKRQSLLVNPLSFSGPCMAKGDFNSDGLDDIYVGGDNGQAGKLFIGQKNEKFIQKSEPAFDKDKASTDADALFFDANGDGFTDLYVVSGGYDRYTPDDELLQDRLYVNDGKGNLSKDPGALPVMHVSKSCIRATDINNDGHPDLFVGGRVVPGRYPETPRSFLLLNDGKGHFTDKTAAIAPGIQKAGMVTDAAWVDINGDSKNDLIMVGEWMPITIYINNNGKLEDKTADYFDRKYSGWWNRLLVNDMNHDGKPDLIVGNLGLNSQCRATEKQPAELYYKDFDKNGTVDPVLNFYIGDTSYPYVSRDELLEQVGMLRPRFVDYRSYANATMKNIFTAEELKGAGHLEANCLQTVYLEMGEGNKFHQKELPLQVQYSPVFTITRLDFDKDGNEDILLCGNINHARIRFGKSDANYGTLLKGDGKGHFSYIDQQQSGFRLWGDVRSVLSFSDKLLFGMNQGEIKAYSTK